MTILGHVSSLLCAVLGVLAAPCLGCASLRASLVCPDHGGPPWSEITSSHLVLKTDLEPSAARDMSADLERLYDALAHVMPRPRRAPGARVEVVVFARRQDYAALSWPSHWMGFFTPKLDADFEPQPVTVLYDDPPVGTPAVFSHELAHRFLRERFPSLPPWLDEGLAEYYATIRVEADRIVLGEPRPAALGDFAERPVAEQAAYERAYGRRLPPPLPVSTAPSLRQLLAAGHEAFHARGRETQLYAAAWHLSHLLMSRAAGHFSRFLGEMEQGSSHAEAFRASFGPDLTWIETAYVEHLTEAQLETWTVPYRPPPAPRKQHHVMRDASVHRLWARLRPWTSRTVDDVGRELEEAGRCDPEAAETRFLHGKLLVEEGRADDATRELDAALAAHPEDPRYLYGRLVATTPRPEGDEPTRAMIERLARAATTASELRLVADYYGLTVDRPHEGLVFAERALRADPMCWSCEKTRSRLYFLSRRYEEAVLAADRALVLVPEGEPANGLRSERELFARVRDEERRLPSRPDVREPRP